MRSRIIGSTKRHRPARVALTGLCLFVWAATSAPDAAVAETATPLDRPVVFCQLPVDTVPAGPRAGGMLPADYGVGARLMLLGTDGRTVQLAEELTSACDPDVSYDGERILFAGQRVAGDPWTVWEVHADGSDLRQITHGPLDARNPIYLATLYTITSSEPWYTVLFVGDDGVLNEAGSAPGTSLYTVRLDGSELRRITLHPGNDRTPFLMDDGFLLFAGSRLEPGAVPPRGRVGLFGLQADGVDYSAYSGWSGRRIRHMPTATAETVVFVESDAVPWDGAGQLAAVDRSRPHHSYRPLTTPKDGLFHSPAPAGDGLLIVSHRTTEGVLEIVLYSPAQGVVDTVYSDSAHHALHPRVVAPRPEPDGRSSTVRPEAETGKLFGLDVYESDTPVANLPRGSVQRLRVIEGVPASADSEPGSAVFRRLLGEAPVESDGSFHIDIPADTPVQLQLIDADGLALATCDWIWVKQREFRGCIGCHEDPELTPPNRFVEAARRPANQLTLPSDQRRSVTFREQIAPILRSRCASCHADTSSRLRLDPIETSEDLEAVYHRLLEASVRPGRARESSLIQRLLAPPATSDPHHDLLTPDEMTALVEWIDLGAQWSSGSETTKD